MPDVVPSPSAVHMTLVYLRNKVFRDTTVSKKGPPTPREEHQRKQDERKAAAGTAPDAQESMNAETDVNAQESHDESEKEKKDKSPPHPKKHQKKVRLIKSKEYKTWQPK